MPKKIDLSGYHYRIQEWIEKQNKPKTWIAKQIGVSTPTLLKYCKDCGIKFHWPVDEIKKLVEQGGLKHWEVGDKLGIDRKYVSDLCKKNGIKSQRRGPRSGVDHPDWKGGQTILLGYRYLYTPGHPNAKKPVPYVAEHRMVMEGQVQRHLLKGEVVHHINGDTLDNRPENLKLYAKNSDHLADELKGRVPNWSEAGKVANQQRAVRYAYNRPGLTPDERETRQILAHWTA